MLIAPSSNRVYADSAPRMTAAELAVFDSTVLAAKVADVVPTDDRWGAVPRLPDRRTARAPATSRTCRICRRRTPCSNTSTTVCCARSGCSPLAHFDDDLLTIQKYAGKTNEQFTKLLLNVTLLASNHAGRMLDRRLTVLDPLCGRGTTLNQALMYGYDAIGIDTDGKDFDVYSAFIRTWLRAQTAQAPRRGHAGPQGQAHGGPPPVGDDRGGAVADRVPRRLDRGSRVPQGRRRRRDRG